MSGTAPERGDAAPATVSTVAGLCGALGLREDRVRAVLARYGESAPGGCDGPWPVDGFAAWFAGFAFTKSDLARGIGRNRSRVSRIIAKHGGAFPGGPDGPWEIAAVGHWWSRELKEPNVPTIADRDGGGLTAGAVAAAQAPKSSPKGSAKKTAGASAPDDAEDPGEALRAERERQHREQKQRLDLDAKAEALRKLRRENDLKDGALVETDLVRRALEGRSHLLVRAGEERIQAMRREFVGLRTEQEAGERLAELLASVLALAVTADPEALLGRERSGQGGGQGVAA